MFFSCLLGADTHSRCDTSADVRCDYSSRYQEAVKCHASQLCALPWLYTHDAHCPSLPEVQDWFYMVTCLHAGVMQSRLVQGSNHLWGSSWQFLDPRLLCRYHEQGGVTCLCWILEEISIYQRSTVRYFHRSVGSSLLLYTMSQYSRTWQNSGSWSLEDWSKCNGCCKHVIVTKLESILLVAQTPLSHETKWHEPKLLGLLNCIIVSIMNMLFYSRYKDYKLKDVQICHFLDLLPATGTSKSSF